MRLLAAACGATLAFSACSIPRDSDIVIYAATGAGGVGQFSDVWTRAFFAWWASGNPVGDINAHFIEDASELADYYVGGCRLSDAGAYPRLRLYAQPGGDADNASIALGTGGRDNILDFAASPQGHYRGTCAGFYYAAGSYWWDGMFYGQAWMPHWLPTVEGPISEIAQYPAYAPTKLSNGLTVVYWGGPALGLNLSGSGVPAGASVVASFADATVPRTIPAVIQYQGPYVRALLNSPHPEAQAGVGLSCSPPLPPGCLTDAQQLANWQFLASNINTLLQSSWRIPTSL